MRTILKNNERGEVSGWVVLLVLLGVGFGIYHYGKSYLSVSAAPSAASQPVVSPNALDMGYQWNLYTLDGRTIPFESLKGKTIFLNFFGTRCAPCIYEMPMIQKMYERVKDKGVEVVVMSSEDAGTLSSYMASNPFTFPMYRFEPPIEIGKTQLAGIPATMIITPSGKVARVQIGPDAWDSDANIDFILGLANK